MTVLRNLLKTYGYWGLYRLVKDYLHTKLMFPGARMVRSPIYVRGKANIHWGNRLTTGVGVRLDVFCSSNEQRLFFGDDVQLNDYVHIGAIERVEIGNEVLIASKVFISDHNHGGYGALNVNSEPSVPPSHRPLVAKPVCIGDRVWIGEHVCILPGVRIGEGAIVGAGSVVTRDVPENSIVAGNPARVLRVFNAETRAWQRV